MIRITYQTYSKLLDKHFEDVTDVKSMADWNLYNLALFHGKAKILKTEAIAA